MVEAGVRRVSYGIIIFDVIVDEQYLVLHMRVSKCLKAIGSWYDSGMRRYEMGVLDELWTIRYDASYPCCHGAVSATPSSLLEPLVPRNEQLHSRPFSTLPRNFRHLIEPLYCCCWTSLSLLDSTLRKLPLLSYAGDMCAHTAIIYSGSMHLLSFFSMHKHLFITRKAYVSINWVDLTDIKIIRMQRSVYGHSLEQ